jgi:hypothetical protein
MSSRLFRTMIAVALSTVIISYAPVALACGPFTLSAIFTHSVHPEYPLERFAEGKIGVVQTSYARSYLVVAYRYLAGNTLSETAQKGAVDLWKDRLDLRWPDDGNDASQLWLNERAKVPGVGDAPKIEVYRTREKPNEYDSFLNCQKDAFKTAAATLGERIAKYGPDNPWMKDWVTAQDQVFSNCGAGKQIPPAAPSGADALIKSDRDYQIAAANFYATSYSDARSGFERIAKENSSPWRTRAPYLVARTYVREASLGADESKPALLASAEKQLNAVLKDPAARETHEDARRLLTLVRLRLHPEERARELGQSLLDKKNDADFKQNLWDYTMLLDQFVLDPNADEERDVPAELRRDELTDWIATFQSDKPEAISHAIERWQATNSLPWLIAALAKAKATDGETKALISAAENVAPNSPAFPSAAFYAARLSIQAGQFDGAKTALDRLLTQQRDKFDTSGINELMTQRMLLAKDIAEFLTYAQQVPATFSWDDDGREIPAEGEELSGETKALNGKVLFDSDATRLFNEKFPLSIWRQAAETKSLALHLRKDVAQAAFLRAVILGDFKTADALVPTLKSVLPELNTYLDKYSAATQPDAKRFSAIYMWLKFPGFEPVVDSGIGRQTLAPSDQDSYRDNWWCTASYDAETPSPKVSNEMIPRFLADSQRAAGEKDYATLSAIGAGPNFLSKEVIQWATKNPADVRVPEALHLAVKSTRYGCTNKETARWSKAAFDLLHRRYGKSAWAKQTPYWFKE